MIHSPHAIRWLTLLGAFVLGLAGGRWLAGPAPKIPERKDQTAQAPERSAPAPRNRPAAPRATYRSADDAWPDRSGPRFGHYAEWSLQAGEGDIARLWALRLEEHGALGRTLDPATALILVRWAELNPTAMIEAVDGSPLGYGIWARIDAEAAVAAARESLTPPTPGRPDTTAKRWTDGDRDTFLFALLQADPLRAQDLLRHDPAFQGASASVAAHLTIRLDPEAFDPESIPRSDLSRPEIAAWAAAAPAAALQWLARSIRSGNSPGPIERRELLAAIALDDPEELSRLAAILPAGEVRSKFLRDQLARLTKRDHVAALAFIRSQDDSPGLRELVTATGIALAEEDPRRSVDLLAEVLAKEAAGRGAGVQAHSPDGSPQNAPPTISYKWLESLAITAPVETMALLSDLPGTMEPRGAAQQLATEWLRYNQTGFADWVQQLAPGPRRDRFVACLVSELAELNSNDGRGYFPDFPLALRWAGRIDDAELRNELTHQTIAWWKKMSPGEAAGFLQSPAAPEEARTIHASQAEENAP